MKNLLTCLTIGVCLSGNMNSAASNATGEAQNKVNWHKFEWHTQTNNYFHDTPNQVMVANFHVGGIPEVQTFILTLSNPFSLLYDYGYDNMVYRNPAFATRTESVQRISTMREQVLRDLEISINRQLLGEDNMRIITTEESARENRIKGELGFGLFHRNRKILLIDNQGERFASVEELPASIEQHVLFVPMKVEAGLLVIPVTIAGRETEMFFDGSSRPALVVFQNRTFRQIVSTREAPEKLMHVTMQNEFVELKGFAPEITMLFKGMPLADYNVYHSGERAPSGIRGKISQAFFRDYIMIFDYKNERFGIVKPEDLNH
ncbi:MAG: hypothetical protein EA361_16765 [Bacteroidetes bacterium]|nr:MAG: hypothetical protein EA361_16765 [Bacteroidota bacterium]